jgi:zinc protease
VIEAERGLRSEHVQGQVQAWLLESVFAKGEAYARPVGGTQTSVAALSVDDLKAFAAARYRPEHMTLYVFAPRRLDPKKLVNDAFAPSCGGPLFDAPIPPSELSSKVPALTPPGSMVRRSAAVPNSELWLAWALPATTLAERAQAELLANVANVAITPAFVEALNVPFATCSANSSVASMLVTCQVELKPGSDAEHVAEGILGELKHAFASGAGLRDFHWLLARQAVLRQTFAEENPITRAIRFDQAAVEHQNPLFERDLASAIEQVDFADVTRQGFSLMEPDKTHMLLVEPLASGVTAPLVAAGATSDSPDLDGSVGAAPKVDPALVGTQLADFQDTRKTVLPNGLTVIAKRWPGTAFTSAVLTFRGGSSWANAPEVTRALDAAEVWKLSHAPAQLGMQLNRRPERDSLQFSVRSVSGDLEKTLELLDSQRSPHIEWPSLSFRRSLPVLAAEDDSPAAVAERRCRSVLLGDHPYAAFAPAQKADSVSVQQLYEFLDSVRRPDNAVLVVVADADPQVIHDAAAARFGSWQNPNGARITALPAITLRPVPSAENKVVIEHRPGATQVDLQIECLLPKASANDLPAQELLGDVLHRYLEEQLRERTGVAYFAASHVDVLAAGANLLRLTTSVAKKDLATAAPFLRRVLEQPTLPFSEDQFAWVKWQWLADSSFKSTTTDSLAHLLSFAWQYDLSLSDLAQGPSQVNHLELSDLSSLLKICQSNAVLSAVGDRAAIESALH